MHFSSAGCCCYFFFTWLPKPRQICDMDNFVEYPSKPAMPRLCLSLGNQDTKIAKTFGRGKMHICKCNFYKAVQCIFIQIQKLTTISPQELLLYLAPLRWNITKTRPLTLQMKLAMVKRHHNPFQVISTQTEIALLSSALKTIHSSPLFRTRTLQTFRFALFLKFCIDIFSIILDYFLIVVVLSLPQLAGE